MSRIFAITKILLFVLLAGMTSTVFAQSDDFTTWTKFKVNYKIDPPIFTFKQSGVSDKG